MDNSPSPEKIAANRANAQKSTGPKTPAGRLQFEWRGRPYDFTTPPEPWFTQFITSDFWRLSVACLICRRRGDESLK